MMETTKTKKLSLILSFFLSTTLLFSQTSKGIRLIDKAQFDQAYTAIQKDLANDKYLAFAQYGMGKLYSSVGFSDYHIDTAYYYILLAEKSWGSYETFSEKFPKNYFVRNSVLNELDSIAASNNIAAHSEFILKYKKTVFADRAVDSLAVKLPEYGTYEESKNFLENYKQHPINEAVWKGFYLKYKKNKPSLSDLENFERMYPNFPDKAGIDKDILFFKKNEEKIAFEALSSSTDPDDFYKFMDNYPQSVNAKKIEGLTAKILLKTGNQRTLENYLLRFPNGENKSAIVKKLYHYITKEGDKADLLEFHDKYPGIISTAQLEKDLKNVKIYDYELGLYNPEKKTLFETYIKQYAPKDKAYRTLRKLIKPDLKREDLNAAAKTLERLKPFFKEKNESFNKLYTILTTKGQIVHTSSIGKNVNTPAAKEYAPIISTDGKTLLICRNKSELFSNDENIHVSKMKDGIWQTAESIPELSTSSNEAPEALSADGNSMILFVEGKICTSEKLKDGWSKPTPLSNAINKNFWQADARITADGKAILFASGSSVYADDIDIYVSVKQENGQWTRAHTLGNIINTNKADRAPFLHPDLKTLYFCSKGHVGIGEFDVFVSKRLDEGWTNWSEPVNLGIGINTANNEWEFKVTTDGTLAYFSKEKPDGDIDIYVADLPEAYQPEKVATISGSLKGINGAPISADIIWEDLETGEVVQVTRSDPSTGDFFATLPELGRFGYSIRHPGFFPLSGNVDLTEGMKNFQLEEEMVLATIEEMKAKGLKFNLNNLFFETAKYDIQATSYPELNRLANLMKQYNLSIEILGHTDNVGEEIANQILSENRAKAVKDYLIAKECLAERITAIGFGERDPVTSNDSVKGRAKNRRVEIRVRD